MSNDNGVNTKEIDPALDFFAGTVAGIAALAVGFPFDTVKVRFQSAASMKQYKSTFHAFFTILQRERLTGLYRGIASPLVTAAPLNGLVFSSYRYLNAAQAEKDGAVSTLVQVALAGAGTGVIATLITTPTELIKTRLQLLQSTASVYRTASSAAKPDIRAYAVALQIVKDHGIKGLYRGVTATALRDIGYGSYFAAYEATMRFWPCSESPDEGPTAAPWSAMLCAGGLAGIAGWVATFPFDVVKTRVQSTHSTAYDNPYRTTWSTIAASYRAGGLAVFFRGLAPTLIRAIPVNMVTFTTFEAIVHTLS